MCREPEILTVTLNLPPNAGGAVNRLHSKVLNCAILRRFKRLVAQVGQAGRPWCCRAGEALDAPTSRWTAAFRRRNKQKSSLSVGIFIQPSLSGAYRHMLPDYYQHGFAYSRCDHWRNRPDCECISRPKAQLILMPTATCRIGTYRRIIRVAGMFFGCWFAVVFP